MHITWGDPSGYQFKTGDLYIGKSLDHRMDVGVSTERHALTVAGARSGKGAGVIIPNLLRWPDSALVIDPKGEAAEATAEHREKEFGQAVHVLDPFDECDLPDRFKARFNPLDEIDPHSLSAREEIGVLTDGLILRDDPKAGFWDGGGKSIISGLIAHILSSAPDEYRNLPEIRQMLNADDETKEKIAQEMMNNGACGDLPREGGSKLLPSTKAAESFLEVAEENTKWLSAPAIASMMSDSTFRLSDLKQSKCTVYLVLPAHLIGEHGRFLRLFVRSAINAMAKGGHKNKNRCLFLLDEFFSLGHMDIVAKSAGLMPGYGVHLWPILQDLGQLYKLYGRDEAQGFIGNADVLQFFGVSDEETPKFVSQRLGVIREDEVMRPPEKRLIEDSFFETKKLADRQREEDIRYTNEMARWQKGARNIGTPRANVDEVVEMVEKKDGSAISDQQIVFIKNSPFLLRLAAHFLQYETIEPPPVVPRTEWQKWKDDLYTDRAAFLCLAGVIFVLAVLALLGQR